MMISGVVVTVGGAGCAHTRSYLCIVCTLAYITVCSHSPHLTFTTCTCTHTHTHTHRYIMEDVERHLSYTDQDKNQEVTWDEYKKGTFGDGPYGIMSCDTAPSSLLPSLACSFCPNHPSSDLTHLTYTPPQTSHTLLP